MNRIVLLSLMLWPAVGLAQKKQYLSLVFSKDFPHHYHVIGAHFTANRQVAGGLHLGVGGAMNRFDNIEKFYFPVYGNISFIGTSKNSKVFPVFFVQPGYGFYHRRQNNITTKGGFTFHAGGGIGYPFLWKTRGYVTFGVGHYGFRGGETDKTSLGGRIGMMF